MSTRIPKILYHYCSLPTFQKIVETQTIWLSDISKSNDAREMKWIFDEYSSYLTQKEIEYLDNRSALFENVDEKAQGNCEKLIPEYSPTHLNNARDNIKLLQRAEMYQSYVFCLTELSDSLSQWRGYADDGCGIAIGFKGNCFSIFNFLKGSEIENMISFGKISYGSEPAKRYFDESSGLDKISMNSSSAEIKHLAERAALRISQRAAFYKSASFHEEKEWRLAITFKNYDYDLDYFDIASLNSSTNKLFKGKFSFDKFGFISTRDRIIPHIELTLPRMNQIIKEIYIGPKSKISPKDMRMFLIANGLLSSTKDRSIEIHVSASSYR